MASFKGTISLMKRVILSVVVACAILTYGGVSVFVVVFGVYPIAARGRHSQAPDTRHRGPGQRHLYHDLPARLRANTEYYSHQLLRHGHLCGTGAGHYQRSADYGGRHAVAAAPTANRPS